MPAKKPELTEAEAQALGQLKTQAQAEKHFRSKNPNPSATDWMLRVSQHEEGYEEATPEKLKKVFSTCEAYAFQLEEGEKTGYRHFQCFAVWPSNTRLSTILRRFKEQGIHCGWCFPRRFSVASCVTYCTKEKTRVEGPWLEGSFRTEAPKKASYQQCVELLSQGHTVQELLTTPETQATAGQKIMALRSIESAKLYEASKEPREVKAYYLWGPPRTGKSFSVTQLRHKPEDCFTYNPADPHPWDAYVGEPVLVLDEFSCQPDFHSLCTWLEPYPVTLPARYAPKYALWEEVWLISNHSLAQAVEGYRHKGVPEAMLKSLPGRISLEVHRTLEGEKTQVPEAYAQLQSELASIKTIPLAKLN